MVNISFKDNFIHEAKTNLSLLLTQVRVLKIDAVSQMRVEYQNAIVHQARVQQAQRLREEVQSKTNELEDAVKSAMCPFLVLEVRRDHLIDDTLNQINLKVCVSDSSLSRQRSLAGVIVLCSFEQDTVLSQFFFSPRRLNQYKQDPRIVSNLQNAWGWGVKPAVE